MKIVFHLTVWLHQRSIPFGTRRDTPVVPNRRIMPALRSLHGPTNNGIGKLRGFLLELRESYLRRLLLGRNVSKLILNDTLRLGGVDIANYVKQNVVRPVVRPVPRLDIILLPAADETLLPDGEALGESVLPVQGGENLALDAIFDSVDHGHLRKDGRAFLLQTRWLHPRLHDVAQRVKGHGEHGNVAPGGGCGTGGVKDGVMKIGIGIRLRPSAK
mmetsp:Transcript_10219/g.20458  ORF Transcript_10219/g.20458 Transcript_10219/m.20458 type:complete len:216 (+) Transcript_10219:2966-3613(+)